MSFNIEGRELTRRGPRKVRLGVEDGRFVEPNAQWPTKEYTRGLLLPGLIDPHVHLREPGHTHKEDSASGSRALARGGIVLACDMPNTNPPTTTKEAFEDKASRLAKGTVIDAGIAVGLGPRTERIEGASFYKLYAGPTTNTGEVDPTVWVDSVRRVAGHRPVFVHAEHPDLLKGNGSSLKDHARVRPTRAEEACVRALLPAPGRMHLCHASSPAAVRMAKEAGWTVEATLHHLLRDTTNAADLGPYARVNPPIRPASTRRRLKQLFEEGMIDALASDHAPHTKEEKEQPFPDAPSGAPNGEVEAPVALALALQDKLPLARVVDGLTTGPASVLGTDRGRLRIGAPADWVHLPPPSAISPVKGDELLTRPGWCLFEGWPALFPAEVWCRGQQVVDAGEVLDVRGRVERFPSMDGA